jgi:hypothetical protein
MQVLEGFAAHNIRYIVGHIIEVFKVNDNLSILLKDYLTWSVVKEKCFTFIGLSHSVMPELSIDRNKKQKN